MFTCMDITMAPGGQGGRWRVLRTDRLFLPSGGNKQADGGTFFKEEEKGEVESQSVNGVTTNPRSHNQTGKTRISQRQQIKTNNKIVGMMLE